MTYAHPHPSALLPVCIAALMILAWTSTPAMAVVHNVGPGAPLVIPIAEVIGGADAGNNAKNKPGGGYFSAFDTISQFAYPATHGNQLGATAMVNDHTYWDSAPGGLDATHAPLPDAGGGNALWWPIPGEWAAYEFTVTTPGTFSVLYRFSTSWGPSAPVIMQMTVDGISSGPITMKPDDPKLWSDTKYQVGGWWGHTMVSGTTRAGWKLGAGPHVLKVQIDSFPDKPKDHGNLWIHYFKVFSNAAAQNLNPKLINAANATFKRAVELEKKGQLGNALAAYEKALDGVQPGSEQFTTATARAADLRAQGEERLSAAKALSGDAAVTALKKIAGEFTGSDIGTAAAKASLAKP